MPITKAAAERALNTFTETLYLSLHTGDPGEDGANEIEALSYRRQPIQMERKAPGVRANTSHATFNMLPVGTKITHGGLWTRRDGGIMLWSLTFPDVPSAGAADLAHVAPGDVVISLVRREDIGEKRC